MLNNEVAEHVDQVLSIFRGERGNEGLRGVELGEPRGLSQVLGGVVRGESVDCLPGREPEKTAVAERTHVAVGGLEDVAALQWRERSGSDSSL